MKDYIVRGIGLVVREELVDVMGRLYQRGLISSRGGNASALVEIAPGFEVVYITPSSVSKHRLRVDDIAVIDIEGNVVQGRPSSEYQLHLAIYRTRRDVRAVVHAHNPLVVAYTSKPSVWSSGLEESVEAKYYTGPIAVVPVLEPGSAELAREVAERAKEGYNTIVLAGHGVVGLGRGPDPVYALREAIDRIEALEDLAKIGVIRSLMGR